MTNYFQCFRHRLVYYISPEMSGKRESSTDASGKALEDTQVNNSEKGG